MLYLGIDVGKRAHEAALLDDAGATLWRHRVAASRDGFAASGEHLAGVDGAVLTVGLEATGVYWLALHAWLTEHGVARVLQRLVGQRRTGGGLLAVLSHNGMGS